jgi:hypothetical protein
MWLLLYDDEPNFKEITKRDVFGTSDLLGFFNRNNDGQQIFNLSLVPDEQPT